MYEILRFKKSPINNILLIFAFIFSGFVTSRSLIPGLSFTLFSIAWLIFCLPFYYHRKIISVNPISFTVIFFMFIVLFSGIPHIWKSYAVSDMISLAGSVAMYFILISLINSHDIIKKIIIINILVTIPIIIIMSMRSWFYFDSLWLSPYWNNNYALGKNTVGFFTVFCFNYLYSYFIYKKTFIKFFGLIILSLVTFYTVSRGALISWVMIIFLKPFFSTNKKSSLLPIGGIAAIYIIFVTAFNFNPLSNFIKIKQRGTAQLGYQTDQNNLGNFLNIFSSNSPGSKYGLSQRASHYISTINSFKIKPLLGSGAGSFRRNEGTLAHNDYLTILYEYGLIGLVVFLLIGLQHFYYLVKFKYKTSIKYRWISEATAIQIIILAFTFLTVDAYMIPFTWYILAISYSLIKLA